MHSCDTICKQLEIRVDDLDLIDNETLMLASFFRILIKGSISFYYI